MGNAWHTGRYHWRFAGVLHHVGPHQVARTEVVESPLPTCRHRSRHHIDWTFVVASCRQHGERKLATCHHFAGNSHSGTYPGTRTAETRACRLWHHCGLHRRLVHGHRRPFSRRDCCMVCIATEHQPLPPATVCLGAVPVHDSRGHCTCHRAYWRRLCGKCRGREGLRERPRTPSHHVRRRTCLSFCCILCRPSRDHL